MLGGQETGHRSETDSCRLVVDGFRSTSVASLFLAKILFWSFMELAEVLFPIGFLRCFLQMRNLEAIGTLVDVFQSFLEPTGVD